MPKSKQIKTHSIQTRDFCELQDAASDWDQEYFQMAPGPFKGSLDICGVGERQIMREKWNRTIRYRGTTPAGCFGLGLPLARCGPAMWLGRATYENDVIIQAPDREADLVSPHGWDILILSVSADETHRIASSLSVRDDTFDALHGKITLPTRAADHLRQMGLDLLAEFKSGPQLDLKQLPARSEDFARAFIWELVKAHEGAAFFAGRTRSAVIVDQATDFVLSRPGQLTGLTEICAHVGVSLRGLHYVFNEVCDMAPATWLRRTRLNHIRAILKRASPHDVFIKDVAHEFGFHHIGHFNDQYRHLFGELPMQTLKCN